ncbi:hypothetical protein [Dysgonomonas sp.]|uniref:hypothetical protein n=1 Tax=Dysgonomonas sp. TaxID=1891233 RepID=UPI0027BA3502|nr:hypothetical protein [Dysgonomonas sp.]
MTEDDRRKQAEKEKEIKIGCIVVLAIIVIGAVLIRTIGPDILLGIGTVILLIAFIAMLIYSSKINH